MENTQNTEINLTPTLTTSLKEDISKIEDVRQSQKWASYLELFGWKSTLLNGINIELRKTIFGIVAKIQRPKNLNEKDIASILTQVAQKKISFLKIEPNLMQNMMLFNNNDFVTTTAYLTPPTTLVINLKNKENGLWNNISHSGRYSINRAQREGARVETISNPKDNQLEKFLSLNKESANKKNFPAQTVTNLIHLKEVFGNEFYLVFVYDFKNNLCGGKVFLGHKNTVWYMFGGTSILGRSNKTGYALLWEAIMYFKKNNYEFLDLEGKDDERIPHTTKAWGGFSHFKEKFGGVVVEYPLPQVKYKSTILKFAAKHGLENIF